MKILNKLDTLDNIQDGETRKLITKTESTGDGNAITGLSVSGDTLTLEKNATFATLNELSSLKGKKIVVMGDSISAHLGTEKGWAEYLAENTGAIVTNVAVTGSTVGKVGDAPSILDQFGYIPAPYDYDYIVIMGGGNDFLSNRKIGSTNEWNDETLIGGFMRAFQICATNVPHINIIVISDPPIYDSINDRGYEEYIEATARVCNKFHIPFLNLWAVFSKSPFWPNQKAIYWQEDNLHLTLEGQQHLSHIVQSFIENPIIYSEENWLLEEREDIRYYKVKYDYTDNGADTYYADGCVSLNSEGEIIEKLYTKTTSNLHEGLLVSFKIGTEGSSYYYNLSNIPLKKDSRNGFYIGNMEIMSWDEEEDTGEDYLICFYEDGSINFCTDRGYQTYDNELLTVNFGTYSVISDSKLPADIIRSNRVASNYGSIGLVGVTAESNMMIDNRGRIVPSDCYNTGEDSFNHGTNNKFVTFKSLNYGLGNLHIIKLTQAQYDALQTKDDTALYIIVG